MRRTPTTAALLLAALFASLPGVPAATTEPAPGAATEPAPAPPAAPRTYRATYRLSSDSLEIGELRQDFVTVGPGRYRFTSEVVPAGFLISLVTGRIEEVSELDWHDGRLRPSRYSFTRRGVGKNRDVRVNFDWVRSVAENDVNGKAWTMEVPGDAIDKHSLVLAVGADLRDGLLADAYPVADGGRLKRYLHQAGGTEAVDTPLGRYDAVTLNRIREGRERGTLFWHAPELDYLPVKVERVDSGGRLLRLLLTGFEPLPGDAAAQAAAR